MKRIAIAMTALLLGAGIATTVTAQGRHDEKPHGSTKPSASATEGNYEPMPGGRHDEKPHGPRKPVQKAESAATTAAGKAAK